MKISSQVKVMFCFLKLNPKLCVYFVLVWFEIMFLVQCGKTFKS